MRFVAHASSSAGNLCEVSDGDRRLAIECGVRFVDMKRALGYSASKLDGVLVTHYHGDHSRAARDVVRAGVPLLASEETISALELPRHGTRVLRPGVQTTINGWRVVPFETIHDVEGALGFLVASPSDNDKLVFACDTRYVSARFSGLTHIAIECNHSRERLLASDAPDIHKMRVLRWHMSIERLLEMLAVTDLSRVRGIWLLHISDTHGDADSFRRRVQEATGKPVYVAPGRLRDE